MIILLMKIIKRREGGEKVSVKKDQEKIKIVIILQLK